MIDVAIIGCGYVAEGHLGAWKKVPNARVIAVVDLNEDLAKVTAKRWRIEKYYKTLPEAISQGAPSLIDICTPPQVHAPLAIEAMEAGIDVLIEKPMTMTVKDAQQIVDCQMRTGVKAGVLHNWLFDYPVLVAKSMVKKGYIGKVFNVEVEALSTKEDSMAINEHHWCHRLPGGRFSEMLVHPIYLVRDFLGGEVQVAAVQVSKIGSYPWMKSDELSAIFKVDAKIGRAYASFNSSRDAIYVRLYGENGIIMIDIINSTVTMLPKRKTSRFNKGFASISQASQLTKCALKNTGKVMFKRWNSGHDAYIKLFSKCLTSDSAPPISVKDGLLVISTLEDMCKKIAALEQSS